MRLQNLTVIFIIIVLPVILLVSLYISTGLKTIKYQALYDTGLLTATYDAIYAFEQNTANDEYSANPETKRDILKASIKMFEKSLCNTCNISSYSTEAIEEYIPAIVFGMYDGFYMYAPSLKYDKNDQKEYTHSLKNYVYYSETLADGTIIRYSLDNYVVVSGDFGVKEGYLIPVDYWDDEEKKYIDKFTLKNNTDELKYFENAYNFTIWFNGEIGSKVDYLNINYRNNPEDESSLFVQHKREIIKQKIEGVLNSSITAYSERNYKQNYKMPKLSEEDWQKIYSNISMITFFQGKTIGLTKYNGYCVLNSTNNNEYVNPNLMYFIDEEGIYHDIRCRIFKEREASGNFANLDLIKGYKIGDFQKIKLSIIKNADGTPKKNADGQNLYDNDGEETTNPYKYKYDALACYECINGQIDEANTVMNFVNNASTGDIPYIYYTSLARERYNTTKLQ